MLALPPQISSTNRTHQHLSTSKTLATQNMGASAAPMLIPMQCFRLRSHTQPKSCLSLTRARYHCASSLTRPITTAIYNADASSMRAHRQPFTPQHISHTQRRTAMKGGQTSAARSQMKQNIKYGHRDVQAPFDRKQSQGTISRIFIEAGDMPDDAPLFPGTLIMPKFADLWRQLKTQEAKKIAHQLGRRRKLSNMSLWDRTVKLNYHTARQMLRKQFDRCKRHGQDFISIIYQWRYGLGWPGLGIFKNRQSWRKMRPQFRKMQSDAEAMYEEMYIALYSNDSAKLKEICCANTSKQLAARCRAQQDTGISYDWKLVKHLGWQSPRVMSHKAAPWPMEDGSGFPMIFRQAVIRMHSRQRLTPKKHGVKTGGPKEVDTCEFVVLQKRFYMGKEEPWKIWGTIQEATSAKEWQEMMYPDPMAGALKAIGST